MKRIELAQDEGAIRATHRVMVQLRSHLGEDAYVRQVEDQMESDAYRLVALYEDDEVRAVAGFRLARGLSAGRYVYIDDLVTDSEARSSGYGRELLDWIAEYGSARGCQSLHLDSGVQRHAAHRFYLRERMDIVFYHFAKALDGGSQG